MKINEKTVNAGDPVWIMGRDRNGYYITSFMFIAAVGKYAILSPYFANLDGITEVLDYYADKFVCSLESDTPPFSIVPKENCYATQKQAEESLRAFVFGESPEEKESKK